MNIAKLNTVSLDDNTFIIKRGTSGGGTINNQDKVVDITENGTVDIVPDAGYTGLSKVTANVNVASSDGELEGEYYLVKPNGWYWKLSDEFFAKDITTQLQNIAMIFIPSTSVFEVIYDSGFSTYYKKDTKLCIRDIGMFQAWANENIAESNSKTINWRYIAEGGPTKISQDKEYNSLYDAFINMAESPMTEAEFETMMLSQYGFQRISEEEYNSINVNE